MHNAAALKELNSGFLDDVKVYWCAREASTFAHLHLPHSTINALNGSNGTAEVEGERTKGGYNLRSVIKVWQCDMHDNKRGAFSMNKKEKGEKKNLN